MSADTIAAISTAVGEAAISVLRLSGAAALQVAAKVVRTRAVLSEMRPREAHRCRVTDAAGDTVDQAMVIVFRTPASYTGEDVVELHCHGGTLVTRRVLELLLQNGARQAEPGEFTQRAFLNGKLDLTQAEAVMDLIHAHSTLAMRAANEQLQGSIGRESGAMREGLIQVLAHIEACIDFPEEGISPETGAELVGRLDALIARASRLLATAEHGRILRQGARTVICGEPNVGKSSLLNLLAGFERAIVSPTAGTTRDTIEEFIQVHGIPLRLVDTAGLRESEDVVERSGIERTNRELERADLVLEVVDASLPEQAARRIRPDGALSARSVLVLNKSDLGIHSSWRRHGGIAVSCLTGDGIEGLRNVIRDLVMSGANLANDHPVAINARHKACFEKARQRLEAAREALLASRPPEFVALDVREAMQALGEVVGQVDHEQVLDQIFSSFCIGK